MIGQLIFRRALIDYSLHKYRELSLVLDGNIFIHYSRS